jgi:two-component sensor histidine kinase
MALWNNSQARMSEKVEEKEVLLSEVNHRVRNNLNVIISLMKLQQASVENKEIVHAIEESKQRVYSMAAVHNRLYGSDNLKAIEINDYVHDLVNEIRLSTEKNIEISINTEKINLDVSKAIPLGLILNELLTNSFKHAFKGRTEGKIFLDIYNFKNSIQLNYSDNGNDFKLSILNKNKDSLGISIIESLVEQISGTHQFLEDDGFKFNLEIPQMN